MEIIERREFKNEILSLLRAGERIAIFAPQFFGKTTFLNQIYEELTQSDDIVLYIKFQQIFNAFDFFSKISEEIKIHFDLNLDLDENDITTSIINAFYIIGNLSEKSDKRIYIIIDDFDEIINTQSIKFELNKAFNDVFTHFNKVVFCFSIKTIVGVNFFSHKKSSLLGFAKVIDLPKFSDIDAALYLIENLKEVDIKITDEELVKKILRTAKSMPYYLNSFCREFLLIKNAKGVDELEVKEEDFNKAYDEIYESEKYSFSLKMRIIKGRKYYSQIILKILQGENPYDLSQLLGNKAVVATILSDLEKENIIERNKKRKPTDKIYDPFLERYLLEVYNLANDKQN